jgi:hypothetical protein
MPSPPHKNFENVDAKSYNLRVFWSENVFPKKTVLRVFFFPSNKKIMKFDMIANEIATNEHRTMISQFSPSMISKTHNTMKQNTANVISFQST